MERQQAVALWWKSKPFCKNIGRKSLPVENYLKKGIDELKLYINKP